MASAPPPLGRYHRQIAEARERALVLVAHQEEVLVELLRRWASELTARVTSGVATVSERRTLEVVRELIDDLVLDLASSTRDGIALTASEMEGFHTRATRTLLEDVGRTTVAVGLEGVGTRAAQAVLARPELTTAFVTLREEFTSMAETAIRDAALRGQSPDQLARRLRLMMVGSQGIPDRLLLDQRTIGARTLEALGMDASPENVRAVRREARRVRMRTERIARTEIRTAEHESGVQLAAESPVVSAIQWFLSNRHPAEDICVPPGTEIATSEGGRRIEEVEVGDTVLTHRGRWRDVSRLYRRTIDRGRLVQLRCRAERNRTLDLELTPNHPVLTDRGWIPAGDLRAGMRVATPLRSPAGTASQPPRDMEDRGPRGSGESETSPPPGTGASRRCGVLRRERPRTSRTHHQDSPEPTDSSPCGIGRAQSPTRRPSSWGYPPHVAPATFGLEALPAWSIVQGVVARSWGCFCQRSRRTLGSTTVRCPESQSRTSRTSSEGPTGILSSRRSRHAGTHGSGSPTCPRRSRSKPPIHGSAAPPPCNPDRSRSPAPQETASGAVSVRRSSRMAFSCVERMLHERIMQWSTVERVGVRHVRGQVVHNLEVEDDHSYVAEGIVVHNCDDLATVDWWGLGPGVHPPERVPGVPHPLCLCGRRHVLLPPEQFGLGRGPVPSLRQTPGDIATRNDRAPSESDALRRAFEIGQTRSRVAA